MSANVLSVRKTSAGRDWQCPSFQSGADFCINIQQLRPAKLLNVDKKNLPRVLQKNSHGMWQASSVRSPLQPPLQSCNWKGVNVPNMNGCFFWRPMATTRKKQLWSWGARGIPRLNLPFNRMAVFYEEPGISTKKTTGISTKKNAEKFSEKNINQMNFEDFFPNNLWRESITEKVFEEHFLPKICREIRTQNLKRYVACTLTAKMLRCPQTRLNFLDAPRGRRVTKFTKVQLICLGFPLLSSKPGFFA